MYRIIFDTKMAKWAVELCVWSCYWKRVVSKEFETLDDAEAFCETVGIDRAYRRQGTIVPPAHFTTASYEQPQVLRTLRHA